LLPAPDANYQLTSGTSVAAAHVTGVVALMIERNPSVTADDIRKVLTTTAKVVGKGRDDGLNAGLIDAYQALRSVPRKSIGQPAVESAAQR